MDSNDKKHWYTCSNRNCKNQGKRWKAMHFLDFRIATGAAVRCSDCNFPATYKGPEEALNVSIRS